DRAVDLLLSDTEEDARPFAETLDEINTRRRTLDRDIEQEAARRAERRINARSPHALVLADEDWHQGVVGIVASSIVERFYRPTVLVTTAGDEAGELLKGSARSISGVNVYDAIAGCSELIEQFGGHDHAAGLTLRRANLDAFRECFDEAVGAQVDGSPELLRPVHKVDAPLALDEIGALNDRFWAVLRQFAPHGPANARPVFHARDLALAQSPRRVGSDGKHLKFTVRPGDGQAGGDATMDAIAFGMGEKYDELQQSRRDGQPLELLFSVEENTWRGRTSLQLKVRDVRLQNEGETE
ncbi:MAG: single-stranded-DNA-specific exonuclease RecJ, partial [Bacteroidetes bacterium QS_8_68_15]